MNIKLDNFKKSIKNKRVAVLGMGVSHIPLIGYLHNLGSNITVFDKSDEEKLKTDIDGFAGMDIKYSLGDNYLEALKGFDIIFKTPGMRYDIPQIMDARKEGAVITSETEVFLELCPAEIFGITGSDGKTTTATLIYKLLQEGGYNCWLGGNIGTPLLSKIDEIKKNDMVVLELSSFQLHTMTQSPHTAIITNMSPNHLDVHKSMEEYVAAKKNIFKYQMSQNRLILNYDNGITREFASGAKAETIFFSRKNTLAYGAMLMGNTIMYKDSKREIEIMDKDDIAIPGLHNIENYLAAITSVIDFVKPDAIKRVATTFKGVEHRNEPVRAVGGVRFYNDSIASSPTRTIAGLNSFKQRVILIAGGYDKKISYDVLGKTLLQKVKCLILMGCTGPKIEKALKDEVKKSKGEINIPVYKCDSIEDAVQRAYKVAKKGDIVVLSPASASFDMFKNFEERGKRFKEIVNSIGDIM